MPDLHTREERKQKRKIILLETIRELLDLGMDEDLVFEISQMNIPGKYFLAIDLKQRGESDEHILDLIKAIMTNPTASKLMKVGIPGPQLLNCATLIEYPQTFQYEQLKTMFDLDMNLELIYQSIAHNYDLNLAIRLRKKFEMSDEAIMTLYGYIRNGMTAEALEQQFSEDSDVVAERKLKKQELMEALEWTEDFEVTATSNDVFIQLCTQYMTIKSPENRFLELDKVDIDLIYSKSGEKRKKDWEAQFDKIKDYLAHNAPNVEQINTNQTFHLVVDDDVLLDVFLAIPGVNINATHQKPKFNCNAPLMEITSLSRLKKLLAASADPLVCNDQQYNHFLYCCMTKNVDFVQYYLNEYEHETIINSTNLVGDCALQLMLRALKKDATMTDIIMLLINTPQVNKTHANTAGKTVLMDAVATNSTLVNKILAFDEVDINAVDKCNRNALYFTIKTKKKFHAEIVSILLKAKIDINNTINLANENQQTSTTDTETVVSIVPTIANTSCLHMFIRKHLHAGVVLLLDQPSIDKTIVDYKGLTAQRLAESSNCPQCQGLAKKF